MERTPLGTLPNADAREGVTGFGPEARLKAATVTFASGSPGDHLNVHQRIAVVPALFAPPFGQEIGHALAPTILRETHNHVAMVVDLFKQL